MTRLTPTSRSAASCSRACSTVPTIQPLGASSMRPGFPLISATRARRSASSASSAPDDHAGHHRERHRITPALRARRVDARLALPHLVDRREYGVVLVGIHRGEPRAARSGQPAHDQRRVRLLDRFRLGGQLLELVVATVEAEQLIAPAPPDHLELLLQDLHAHPRRGEREAVGGVLALMPAGSEPELDATARDVVGSDDHLRECRGVAKCRRARQASRAAALLSPRRVRSGSPTRRAPPGSGCAPSRFR